jgi:hypothetical protein
LSLTERMTMVVLPPGGKGMISVIGRSGYSAADAAPDRVSKVAAEPATNARLPMSGI